MRWCGSEWSDGGGGEGENCVFQNSEFSEKFDFGITILILEHYLGKTDKGRVAVFINSKFALFLGISVAGIHLADISARFTDNLGKENTGFIGLIR